MKKITVKLSQEANKVYQQLELHKEKVILKSIHKKVELLKQDFHYGEPIAKNKIPKSFTLKYGLTNLFWIELAKHWRLLYTLTQGETNVEIIAFIVEIADHKTYSKTMKYKK